MLSGCSSGVSQTEYDKVVSERDQLKTDYAELQESQEALEEKYNSQSSDYEEIKRKLVIAEADRIPDSVQSSKSASSNDESSTVESPAAESSRSSTTNATTSQKNALGKAKEYLKYSAFSYEGLIEQLEYEKFSREDATYGADNCGADWMEQAAKKAKEYLDYSSFSREGLIEQLEYEGFTREQAVYGVEENGY